MTKLLTNQTRKALALANEAARNFNHEYVGTEHVLLGLIEDRSGGVTDILAIFGISADSVRTEIASLVQRGSEPVVLRTLPLTPRAKQAVARAADEARNFNEGCVGPEHLLLGLLSEEQGVACHVLLNLGITTKELRAEVFRLRLALMQVVERAVRPVQASTPRKRKMREELLAHISAIYDEERERVGNSAAALQAATNRFGDPHTLADELQSALPFHERISHFIERWFAWRAPESLARYSLRQAMITFFILAAVLPFTVAGVFLGYGWVEPVRTLARIFASILLIAPPAHFAITLLSFKVRNAMWGVFGSRKSLKLALAYDGLIAVIVTAACVGFMWAAQPDSSKDFVPAIFGGAAAALGYFLAGRFLGPMTIRDTYWALLEVESA